MNKIVTNAAEGPARPRCPIFNAVFHSFGGTRGSKVKAKPLPTSEEPASPRTRGPGHSRWRETWGTRAKLPGAPGSIGGQPGADTVGQNEFREKTLEDDRQPEAPEQHLHDKGALSPVQEAPAQQPAVAGHCRPRQVRNKRAPFPGTLESGLTASSGSNRSTFRTTVC